MSRTSIKNRERLGLNPKRVTLKLMFNYQTHLFSIAQRISKSEASENIKQTELKDIFDSMELIKNQLIKRGCLVNPNNHL